MTDKLPKKIKVGAVDYTTHLLNSTDRAQLGVCLYNHQRIYLSPNMKHQVASDTLLHEVLHAIWSESGLDHIPDLNEETVVRALATWLRLVIRDNPEFVKFIVNSKSMWPYGPTNDPDKEAGWHFGPKDEEDDD
jgi:hypothetical protein